MCFIQITNYQWPEADHPLICSRKSAKVHVNLIFFYLYTLIHVSIDLEKWSEAFEPNRFWGVPDYWFRAYELTANLYICSNSAKLLLFFFQRLPAIINEGRKQFFLPMFIARVNALLKTRCYWQTQLIFTCVGHSLAIFVDCSNTNPCLLHSVDFSTIL